MAGRNSSPAAIVLLAGGLVILGSCLALSARFASSDFLGFYAGAKLAPSGRMYQADEIRRIESQYGAVAIAKPYHRPPFYALATTPFALLPYRWAFLLWQTLNLAALCLFVLLWPAQARFRAAVLTLWFAPVWWSFGLAQDMPFLLACAALAGRLLDRRRSLLAGVVLGLCSFKANLLLGIPVMLLSRRMWRVCLGGVLCGAGLYLACAIPYGPGWPAEYRAVLGRTTETLPLDRYFPTFAGLVRWLPESLRWLFWPLAVLAVVLLFAVSRRIPEKRALGLALMTGLLISPFALVYDAAIMLPGAIDVMERRHAVTGVLYAALGTGVMVVDVSSIGWIKQTCLLLIFAVTLRAAFQDARLSRKAPTRTL